MSRYDQFKLEINEHRKKVEKDSRIFGKKHQLQKKTEDLPDIELGSERDFEFT